jgi:hypothetical protein
MSEKTPLARCTLKIRSATMDAMLAYYAANKFAQETPFISILESQKIVQIAFFNRLIVFTCFCKEFCKRY